MPETKLTMSAPTAGTAVSLLPGTLLAGFTPAEVWRNSSKVKLYLGGTVPEVVLQTCSDTRLEVPGRPRAKRLRRRTCSHSTTAPSGFPTLAQHLRYAWLHFAPTNTFFLLIRALKRKSRAVYPTAGGALPELALTFSRRMRKVRSPPRRAWRPEVLEGGCLSDAASPGSS